MFHYRGGSFETSAYTIAGSVETKTVDRCLDMRTRETQLRNIVLKSISALGKTVRMSCNMMYISVEHVAFVNLVSAITAQT